MINDDTKNMMILKAMYAAADELVNNCNFNVLQPVTAAKVNKNARFQDGTDEIKEGAREGYSISYQDGKMMISISVDTFECSFAAEHVFYFVNKFETIAGVPASKKKLFVNPKTEDSPVIFAVKITKAIKSLYDYTDHKGKEIMPALSGVYFDVVNNYAVASNNHAIKFAPAEMQYVGRPKDADRLGVLVPSEIIKATKDGDYLCMSQDGKIYINGIYFGDELRHDQEEKYKYPNVPGAIKGTIAMYNYIDFNKKEFRALKKAVKDAAKTVKKDGDSQPVTIEIFDSLYWYVTAKNFKREYIRPDAVGFNLRGKVTINALRFLKLNDVEKIYFPYQSNGWMAAKTAEGSLICFSLMAPQKYDETNKCYVADSYIYPGANKFTADTVAELGFKGNIMSFTWATNVLKYAVENLNTDNNFAAVTDNIDFWHDEKQEEKEEPVTVAAVPDYYFDDETADVLDAIFAEEDEKKDEKKHETTGEQITSSNDVPEVASIPTVELNVIAAAPAIIDDVTTGEQITASNNLRLLRRIFAAAAVYFVAIFICCNIFGGHDTVKAATTAPQSTITAPADTCQHDTAKTAQTYTNEGITTPADTCQLQTIKHNAKKRAIIAPQSTITAPADICQHDTAKTAQTYTNKGITAPADTCQHQKVTIAAAPGNPSATVTTDINNKTDDGSTLNSGNNPQSEPVPAANIESLTRYSTSQNSPIPADSLPVIGSKIIH